MSSRSIASSSSLLGMNMLGASYCLALNDDLGGDLVSEAKLIFGYVEEHVPRSKTSANCRASIYPTQRRGENYTVSLDEVNNYFSVFKGTLSLAE